jgi:uncharacterized protein YndB with AHSA1/START domain
MSADGFDTSPLAAQYDRETVSGRIISAPLDIVWNAWRDPALLDRWWGPRGFSNTTHDFEFRDDGRWSLTMHGPDGTDYPNVFRFRAIVPHKRIMLEHQGFPPFLLTADFDPVGETTKLTFRQLFDTVETYAKVAGICIPANEDNLDRLAALLAGPAP